MKKELTKEQEQAIDAFAEGLAYILVMQAKDEMEKKNEKGKPNKT